MRDRKIVVIGSSNTDMVVKSGHLPRPGETVLGGKFLMNPGGKGANQAVAAAKLGGNVTFVARVGADVFGREAIKGFQIHGIDTGHVSIDPVNPSGVALIMVDEKGENSISVALGANAAMSTTAIDDAREVIRKASFVLIQLEIPKGVVEYAVRSANKLGVKVVLNPAPAQKLSETVLQALYLITPNESEAELLTGIRVSDEISAEKAAGFLRGKGVKIVIITMGSKGAYVSSADFTGRVPAPQAKAVDSTAAGDTFNGALVVGLAEGMSLRDSVVFANKAAAISVTRMGAQASVPTRSEVDNAP